MSAAASPIADWIARLDAAFVANDPAAVAALFQADGFWRDMLAFSWTIRTFEGADAIAAMLGDRMAVVAARGWAVEGDGDEGFVSFETAQGRGEGYVRLRDGRCATLLTTLRELKGFEEKRGRRRPTGHPADARNGNWRDRLDAEIRELGRTRDPYVLIVGGGQGGLSLAARLRQLDVPAIVVDRNARPGDQWRSRYASLSLHDPVWYDHMPYLPFPDSWPVFTPKDKMAEWLDCYAMLMELNVWQSTEFVDADWDPADARWRVTLRRNDETVAMRPAHVVLATGNAGMPIAPDFPGMEAFGGLQCHSSAHPGGSGLAGRAVVVVGSNNSAHDVCADLADHGADVTMIQRSPTHVIRQQTFIDLVVAGLYSEDAVEAGMTTDRADLIAASMPYRLLPAVHGPLVEEVRRRDADFYRRLEAAGFLVDFGEDGTGIGGLYPRRASGYYIDVGASDLIASGAIKIRSGVSVDHIVADGIVLGDGTHLPADAIIYATGFGSMHQWAADRFAPEVVAKLGRVWGYGSGTRGDPGPWEGELRNMWKPTAQPGLWLHGGNLAQARFYSRFLALQLKARCEGLAAEPYLAEAPAPAARDTGRAAA